MILTLIKKLLCKHEFVDTNENRVLFGYEHVTKICVKCGKRMI